MLDSLLVIGGAAAAFKGIATYGLRRFPFWRYTGPNSDPAGTWVVRGLRPPYGTNYELAMERLSSPILWDEVKRVSVEWYQYVAGPRLAAPIWNSATKAFTIGWGLEYRIGGFKNWGQYFQDWWEYLAYLLKGN